MNTEKGKSEGKQKEKVKKERIKRKIILSLKVILLIYIIAISLIRITVGKIISIEWNEGLYDASCEFKYNFLSKKVENILMTGGIIKTRDDYSYDYSYDKLKTKYVRNIIDNSFLTGYKNRYGTEGLIWSVKVTYYSGLSRTIIGHGEYPKDFWKVRDALESLLFRVDY